MTATLAQYRAQYARNAISAQKRADRVRASGKAKSGGYTVAELQAHADDALRLSRLSDAALDAHLTDALARIRAAVTV